MLKWQYVWYTRLHKIYYYIFKNHIIYIALFVHYFFLEHNKNLNREVLLGPQMYLHILLIRGHTPLFYYLKVWFSIG